MGHAHDGILCHLQVAINELTAALAKAQSSDASDTATRLTTFASGSSSEEYLSVKQLVARIPYCEQTIRNLMSAGEFKEGVHYFKRRRRVMFHWPQVERWLRDQVRGVEAEEPFYPVHNARPRKRA